MTKGFKITLSGIVSLIVILGGLQPYLNLKAASENQAKELYTLKLKSEIDHDIIIKMSTDIQYIKEGMQDIRRGKINP